MPIYGAGGSKLGKTTLFTFGTTQNTYQQALLVNGAGCLQTLAAKGSNSATSATVKVKITIDGSVVLWGTLAGSTSNAQSLTVGAEMLTQDGSVAIFAAGVNNVAPHIYFNTSLKIEILSNSTDTGTVGGSYATY